MPATTRALDETVDVIIGDNVHRLIWRNRLRQNEVAAELGVTGSVFGRKLRGESAWSARQVHRVAEVLGVAVGDLYVESPGLTDPHGSVLVRRQGLEPRTRWLSATETTPPAPPTLLKRAA